MFLTHLLFALLFALILTGVFAFGFRRIGPWASYLVFFSLVFLAAWAGGLWLHPVGPPLWGVSWLPFLIMGLVFALLLAAAIPPEPRESTVELVGPEEKKKEKVMRTALGAFFWILVLALLLLIAAGYFWPYRFVPEI